MTIMVISSSLNPDSKSRVMAREGVEQLRRLGAEVDFADLQDIPLPLAGTDAGWDDSGAKDLAGRIGRADAVILAVPIYTYDVNAACKNLVELTGKGWEGKVVGFICAAGGFGSYMSVMGLANSLMLDFRCLIVPRFVYATDAAWDGMTLKDEKIRGRIQELCREILRVAGALKS